MTSVSQSPSTAPRRLARAWLSWALLAVIIVAALVAGARATPGGHPTTAERAASIDSQIRCPSCEALSVAQSNASTAVAIRHLVLQRVERHQSTAQIERYLASRYGTWILLRPPSTGLAGLVWFIPIAALVLLVAIVVGFFLRRSRAPAHDRAAALARFTPTPAPSADPSAAQVRSGPPAGTVRQAPRLRAVPRRRTLVVSAGVLAAAATAIGLVIATSSPKLPGQSITGSLTLGVQQRTARKLLQARTLVTSGHALEALKLYTAILKSQPHNPSALAESGWLEYEAGSQAGNASLMRSGEASVEEAVRFNPGAGEPHLLLANVLVREGRAARAADQMRLFLADHPSRQLVSAEHATIIAVFRAAGQQPPAT